MKNTPETTNHDDGLMTFTKDYMSAMNYAMSHGGDENTEIPTKYDPETNTMDLDWDKWEGSKEDLYPPGIKIDWDKWLKENS